MFGERYILFRPLFIHSSSAVIERLFSPCLSRPLTSALSVTGHATTFCFLPMHFIYAPLRTHGLGATHLVPQPVGARLRVRQGCAHRLASPEHPVVLRPCSMCRPARCRWDRDHLVYLPVGPGLEAAEKGETCTGRCFSSTGSDGARGPRSQTLIHVCIYGSAVPGNGHTIDFISSLIIDVHLILQLVCMRASY